MGSLLDSLQKAGLESVMHDVHDTFKRTVKAYKEGKKVVISTNPNYNGLYGKPANTQVVPIERTMEVRIYYFSKSQEKQGMNISSEDSLQVQGSEGEVRIKVTNADYEFLADAERITLDGEVFRFGSAPRRHGLFGAEFVTLILKRLD